MSKTCTLLTAALLVVGTAAGRADDPAGFSQPQASSTRRANDHWHTVWGSSDHPSQKIVRVSANETSEAAPAAETPAAPAPTAPAQAAPAQAAPAASDHWHRVWGTGAASPAEAAAAPEAGPHQDHWHACHNEVHGCARKFWDWVTYQPLCKPGLCGCCCKCAPCTFPPLYQFFLCENNYYGGGCSGCAVAGYAGDGSAPFAPTDQP